MDKTWSPMHYEINLVAFITITAYEAVSNMAHMLPDIIILITGAIEIKLLRLDDYEQNYISIKKKSYIREKFVERTPSLATTFYLHVKRLCRGISGNFNYFCYLLQTTN